MHKQNAFTIVELIVVMVIITILAAITIAAYDGIQDEAKRSAIQSDLDSVAKAMEVGVLKSSTNTYPITSTDIGNQISELFSRDAYRWVIYCTDSSTYKIAGRLEGSNDWYIIGSNTKLNMNTSPGTSESLSTTCTNLGIGTPTYSTWLKSNAGWSI